MTGTVRVPLGDRSYDVVVGSGLLHQAGELVSPLLNRPFAAVVTDENVAPLHLEALVAGLADAGVGHAALTLPAGESTKSWQGLERVVEWLVESRVERRDAVIALGGGVIGDLAGFAAAVLRRGVGLVQVPTSLLAQVDSSVGGKTGINSPSGKNLVGAFHQPSLVIADVATLASMDRRHLLAGYAEVAKYGFIGDREFFEWLESRGRGIVEGDEEARSQAVRRSVKMKADIVAGDETEWGDRALLNFGHTFCHALEAAAGYSERLLHGEGVSVGCALAFDLSAALELCSAQDAERAKAHLAEMGMKTSIAQIPGELPDADGLIALMAQDKKVLDGRLRFVLSKGIGSAFVAGDVPEDALKSILRVSARAAGGSG